MKKRLFTVLFLLGFVLNYNFTKQAQAHTPYVNMHQPYTENGSILRGQQIRNNNNSIYNSYNGHNTNNKFNTNKNVYVGTRVVYTYKEIGNGPIEQVVEPVPPVPNYNFYGGCYGGCW